MALNDYKIGATDVATYGVSAAPDKLTGTAAQNKAVFDQFITNKMMSIYNGLITALQNSAAASELGFDDTITELDASKVQTAIAALKVLVDSCSPSSVTNYHFKDVSLNETTGVFTFTREDGSTKTIDTLLEKVVTNWTYDSETQSLVLTLKDGTTVSVSLSAFITETEFEDSTTIDFDVANHKVTASIKSGSITDSMLNSSLLTLMQGYVASCSGSASTATTKASEASGSATSAATSATNASTSASTASTKASEATSSASSANTAATNANTDALKSEGYSVGKQNGADVTSESPYWHNNAKWYKEQAEQAVTGDMTKAVYDTHHKSEDIFDYADQAEADAKTYTDLGIGTHDASESAHSALFESKADKDTNAVIGNVAKFNSDGNPIDSGFSSNDLQIPIIRRADISKAGFHNSLYRGKDLTDIYTLEQLSAKIADGSFEDLFIGDYITKSITIGGTTYSVNWVIADFDYFIKNGDTECTSHHIVLIPSKEIYNAQMNSQNTTANGYTGSAMWSTQMANCASAIRNAFGSGHVLSHRELLSNGMNSSTASMAGAGYTGASNGWTWFDAVANIPNEVMVYGGKVLSSSFFDIGNRKRQLSLFRLSEEAITTRALWWLSAVASSTYFAYVGGDGRAGDNGASNSLGVRPYFLFY